MFGIGFTEILVILVVALIVIGPEKLPEIAKVLGKAYNEFKSATDEIRSSVQEIKSETERAGKSVSGKPKDRSKEEKPASSPDNSPPPGGPAEGPKE